MWNGGKPNIGVNAQYKNGILRIDTSKQCESIEIKIRTTDGAFSDKENSAHKILCKKSKNLSIPISVRAADKKIGYLVIEMTLKNGKTTETQTKSFAIIGRNTRPEETRPTSIDQNGVRYHEFISQ